MTAPRRLTPELRRLRFRLTAWYVATFSATLLSLATVLFFSITHLLRSEREREMSDAVQGSIRAALVRSADRVDPLVAAAEAVTDFDTPDHPVYVFDASGELAGPDAPPAVARAAQVALEKAIVHETFESGTQSWEVLGERFVLGDARFAMLVLADTEPIERQYRRLLEAFTLAGLVAVAMVGFGGYRLARMSTKPVEESVERMRRFVADAAHELRTPIALVRTQAEVTLRREREPAAYALALGSIEQEVTRLGRIAEDLLLLARADSGDRPIERNRFFLDDVAANAVSAAGALASTRNVALELGRYEETAVVGDGELIRQLLMILIDNAIKFTDAGGRVTVSVFPEGKHAVLMVCDDGTGIDPDVRPHVFERFVRGDPARGRSGGAGLGLSIARWIADAHGASLSLEPAQDRGTIARLSMPRAL